MGTHVSHVIIMDKRMEVTVVENQMDKKMGHEMEARLTGIEGQKPT